MRFCRLVMVNTHTGEVRDYFAHLVPVIERVAYGQQLVARDVDGDTLDPAEWVYSKILPAAPPGQL